MTGNRSTRPAPVDSRGPYGTVYRSLWHRSDFQALSSDAKSVFIYAKTCPAGSLVGIFRLRSQDIRDDHGIPLKRSEAALRELETAGFISRDRAWVWIIDALETTPNVSLWNPNHLNAVQKALAQVPNGLAERCRRLYAICAPERVEDEPMPEPTGDPLRETVPEPISNHVDVDVAVNENEDGDNVLSDCKAGQRTRRHGEHPRGSEGTH